MAAPGCRCTNPPVANFDSFLTTVSAISSNDIWAMGFFLDTTSGPHHFQPLALHWNGTAWTSSLSASVSGGSENLQCPSYRDQRRLGCRQRCGGTGFQRLDDFYDALGRHRLEHRAEPERRLCPKRAQLPSEAQRRTTSGRWEGQVLTLTLRKCWRCIGMAPPGAWSRLRPRPERLALNAVVALAANNVWAVGTANGQSLIERWNGRRLEGGAAASFAGPEWLECDRGRN